MKTFVLTRLELRKLWNEFRLSLRVSVVRGSYIVTFAVLLLISLVLYIFLFVLPEDVRNPFLNNGLFRPGLLGGLFSMFSLWALFSVLRGVFVSDLSSMFSEPDFHLLFSSPISPPDLYLSKYFRAASIRTILLSVSFFTAAPLIWYLNLQPLQIVTLFVVVLVFLETTYVLRSSSFFLTQRVVRSHTRSLLVVGSVVLLSLFLAFSIHGRMILDIFFKLAPPSLAVQTALQCVSTFQNWNLTFSALMLNAVTYLGLLLVTSVMGRNYYEKVVMAQRAPWRLSFSFLRGRIIWRLNNRLGGFFMITLKDFWSHLRERGKTFLARIVVSYGFLGVVLSFPPRSIPFAEEMQTFAQVFLPFLIILFISLASPLPRAFIGELGKVWILKVTPLSADEVVYGKFLYGVLLSAVLGLPIISLTQFLPSMSHQLMIIILIPHILLTTNAVGIMIGAHFSFFSQEKPELPLVAYLEFLVLSLIVTGTVVMATFLRVQDMYLFIIILTAMSFTNPESPLVAYLCNLTFRFVVAWVVITGAFFFLELLGRTACTAGLYLIFFAVVSIGVVRATRYCLRIAAKALAEREELR